MLPGEGRRELIDGVLCEMEPAGAHHGEIANEIGALLRQYRIEHGGRAFGAETGFLLSSNPDTVRAPDAAFVSAERSAAAGVVKGYWPGAPDLAVEVVSPSDAYTAVHEKALAWLAAGCQVVLVVDPAAGHVTRYRAADDVTVHAGDDAVDCARAMPGFTPAVRELLATE